MGVLTDCGFGRLLLACVLAVGAVVPAARAQSTPPIIVSVGPLPSGIAIDPSSRTALVCNAADDSISIVDIATARVVATITSIPSPAGIAVNRFTGLAVVANKFSNSVTVIEVATRRTRAVIPVDSLPVAVAIEPIMNLAVVANWGGNSVSLIDLNRMTVARQVSGIPAPNGIQAVAVDSDLKIAAVASSSSNSLFVVDLITQQIRSQIPVEAGPVGVAIDPRSKIAVVANQSSNSVSLVDLSTGSAVVVSGIPQPQAVAIDTASGAALVTTGVNGSLQVVDLTAAATAVTIQDLPGAAALAVDSQSSAVIVALPPQNAIGIVRALGLFSVVNGASFAAGPVASSSIVSGFGSGLAAATVSALQVPLPLLLGNVSVRVGNAPAPLFFVSPGQVNFQVPLLSPGTYPLLVTRQGVTVASGVLAVVSASPAIFTLNSQGTDQAAALNQDNSLNGIESFFGDMHPEDRGNVIQLFGTGGGLTTPQPASGAAATAAANTLVPPTVKIGGIPATVTYSGAAPTLVGVWQLNVRIPLNVTPGPNVPIVATMGGRTSSEVTIAVR